MSNTFWSINGGSSSGSFGDLGLRELTRTRVSQASDRATFIADATGFDGAGPFAFGDTVTIRREGVTWFVGRVVSAETIAAAGGEAVRYELAGPWWYLENCVFQQEWNLAADPTDAGSAVAPQFKSRLVLNRALDGSAISTGAQMTEALTYAIAQGAPLLIGDVTPAVNVPASEVVDRTCAEILRMMLRWSPDAVTWFDYATSPTPTLHIARRADLATQTFSLLGNETSPYETQALRIAPRPDLQTPAVVLKFELTHSVDAQSWTTVTTQAAPVLATGSEFGALVMTIDLDGGRATYQKQKIKTETIEASDLGWWRKKLKWLGDVTAVDSAAIIVPGSGIVSAAKPRELVEGSCPWWEPDTTERVDVTALATYSLANADGGTVTRIGQRIACRVTGTTLDTGDYVQLTSFTEGETVPAGLAASIYEALSVLYFEGEWSRAQEECDGAIRPGMLINLVGGRPEWASMLAQVQSVAEAVDTGVTKVRFGPPRHLSPQDMVELLRANRARRLSFKIQERRDGQARGGAQVEGGRQTANESATAAHDAPQLLKLAAKLSEDETRSVAFDAAEATFVIDHGLAENNRKVTIDLSDLPEIDGDIEVKLREFDVCQDGEAKKVMLLASEPYTPEG